MSELLIGILLRKYADELGEALEKLEELLQKAEAFERKKDMLGFAHYDELKTLYGLARNMHDDAEKLEAKK